MLMKRVSIFSVYFLLALIFGSTVSECLLEYCWNDHIKFNMLIKYHYFENLCFQCAGHKNCKC